MKKSIETNAHPKDKSTKKTNKNEEVDILEKNNEIEPIDDINNARKTRRRSSANIE